MADPGSLKIPKEVCSRPLSKMLMDSDFSDPSEGSKCPHISFQNVRQWKPIF